MFNKAQAFPENHYEFFMFEWTTQQPSTHLHDDGFLKAQFYPLHFENSCSFENIST